MTRVYKLTAFVENAITHTSLDNSNAAHHASQKGGAIDADEKLEWTSELLTFNRQQEIYIRLVFSSMKHVIKLENE